MVAFNFKSEFVDAIKSGKKTSTIRKTKRAKVGDTLQLYTGQRTAKCQKIGDVICTGVYLFNILPDGTADTDHPAPEKLYVQEGFHSQESFIEFFRKQYGLPFRGWLYEWEAWDE